MHKISAIHINTKRIIALITFLICVAIVPVSSAQIPSAQTFTTLASFNGTDGSQPSPVSLAQGVDGKLYGTTIDSFFKISTTGALTTFQISSSSAATGVVLGTDGNFYGTTEYGGTGSACPVSGGCGTVFKVTPTGKLTTIHNFCDVVNSDGICADGNYVYAGLALGVDGNFYGATFNGGPNPLGGGTIFKITPQGVLTTIYGFCAQTNCVDGMSPIGGLVQGTDGNFYGTTSGGGAGVYPGGTIFKITPAGVLTTLYSFSCAAGDYCPDGSYPTAPLVQGTDGNFYGTTFHGGANGIGTIYKITPTGTLTMLVTFDRTNGAYPYAGLIQATDGNLYGTTADGGTNDAGTVFKMTTAGTLTILYSFNTSEGNYPNPYGGLDQATDGNLYGTTEYEGTYGFGTVFKVSTGIAPFVKTLPDAGSVGTKVIVLGSNLLGATELTFNGKAASFRIVSNSEITTTVPNGATTGKLTVKTPRGTLTSNVVFQIIP